MSDKIDKIKITMLGGAGSGKTCYMLGMYAGMQMGMHGFSLSTTNPDVGVVLDAFWENIIDNTGENRWPENTKKPKEYAFNLNYAYNPIIDFEWLDYRGDAMSDKSTDSDDVEELRKHILESSCLFLCVSGEHLRQKVNNQSDLVNLRVNTKANRMGYYISDLSNKLTNKNRKPFPMVILITKYDYCVNRREELVEDLKKLFSPLFVENSGWLLMICPVSLGKDLAKDNEYGKISPLNLHLPVIFALFSNLRSSALENFRQSNLSNKGISQVMNLIGNKENHRSNYGIQISKEIEEKMTPLVRELMDSNVYFYLNGKRIKIGM